MVTCTAEKKKSNLRFPARHRTCIYFDCELSSKGAVLASSRAGRPVDGLSQLLASRAPTGSAGVVGEIFTPNALPMFQDAAKDTKRKREKDRLDPVKSRKPEPPAAGKYKVGSQSGAAATFAMLVADSTNTNKNIAGKDPRQELFKFSEGKTYVTQAYDGEQPNQLTTKTLEEEEEMKSKS